ncbi:D-tyrosyl-tRNA(Tyr) deacylase [Aquirufa nivalisilvae]|uniref:D-aminoacyl-tRNA deacylase n=1 Tax=Aquirufa nivalisilvae TaxID=2516557 RepID=UPI0022A98513|nr:D-aminoacyl-tRNA deacylase [Aquirufa nivalisilvae]MCZ2480979.1 D-tyrosyl-tRNA(Tyr) deacylase [Aquirufa nivalisilvae]MCZ2483712.1 D-tyrosyl-tRNA(Tyr) deacylase [Aquirufa nivalisilvae]
MLAVIQRVSEAKVEIDGQINAQIQQGFLILLGIHQSDTEADCQYLANKISALRIFSDAEGKMNLDIKAVDGRIILVSQFTLIAQTKKGNRPSFIEAARPEQAIPLYEQLIELLENKLGFPIQTGQFGADMQVSLVNDGPVTIIIDSQQPNS